MLASAEAGYTQYGILAKEFAKVGVVSFLDVGFYLWIHREEIRWQSGKRTYLPSGGELAGFLADGPVCSGGAGL